MDNKTPFNLEAEQAVLGALLLDNSIYDTISPYFNASDFYDPTHGRLYEYIGANILGGRKADALTLANKLKDNEDFKAIGGSEYLALLIDAATDSDAIIDYAQFISDLSKRRRLIEMGQGLLATASNTSVGEVNEIIEHHEQELLALQSGVKVSTQFDAGDLAVQFVKDLGKSERQGSKTHIDALDEIIGSLRTGQMGVIGGRPSMGKSALALKIAFNNAMRGVPVAYLSFDMTDEEVTTRLLSMAVFHLKARKVTYKDIDRNNLTQEQRAWVSEAAFWLRELPLKFETKRGLNVPQIVSVIRKIKADFKKQDLKLGLVFLDHLQKVQPIKSGVRDTAAATYNIEALKDAAQIIGAPLWVLCQLNRSVETQDDKRPSMKDLRETGAIEQEANIIMFVYWDAYYLMRDLPQDKNSQEYQDRTLLLEDAWNKYLILPRKVRSGSIKDIEIYCDMTTNEFRDKSYHTSEVYA